MARRRGRPEVEKPRCIKVGFRVTEEERDRLFAYCIVGVAVIGILFLVVILEETIDGVRAKIREI